VRAISKRKEDGIVVVDSELCLGREKCREKCLKACPYGSPQFGSDPDAKMRKCNFCLDRWLEKKVPVCVEACPMRAFDAGPLNGMKAKYGQMQGAVGFNYSKRTRPAIVFKPKEMKNGGEEGRG
jgi:anaerobic dimethyl sulfoxide reductase subunit B (iron-sulfur subunit)